MPQLMLINPRPKRRRKMTAKQRKYFGKRKRVSAKRRTRRRSFTAAPIRRRSLKRNPIVSRKRRFHRNPIGNFSPMGFVKNTLMPSGVGAVGALGLDVLMGFLPLPAVLKGPMISPMVKLVGAVGIGALAGMVTNRRTGEQVAAGRKDR